jgi:hypothetical protein
MDYLLHMPWWVATLIAIVGLWLLVVGNRRSDKTLGRVGAAVLIAAVALGILGFFYLTPLQKAEARTKAIIHDVEQKNWTDLRSLLDDQTVVQAVGHVMAAGRDECVARVQKADDFYGVKSIWIMSTDGMQTDTLITITVTVMSQQDYTGGQGVESTWQLDFQENESRWELEKITLIRIGGEDAQHPYNPFQ